MIQVISLSRPFKALLEYPLPSKQRAFQLITETPENDQCSDYFKQRLRLFVRRLFVR